MPTDLDALLTEMRDRFQTCISAEASSRQRMLLAKQFRGGNQWPDAIRQLREGNGTAGVTATGPRPCLTIDRISQPIQQVVNQIKGAHFSIEVLPNGGAATEAIAELYEGYFRRIQNKARAEDPTGWAAEDAVVAGLGWFGLNSEYCNDQDDDQDLCQIRVDNSLSVYRDPAATPPIFRDGRFAFVTDHLTRDAVKSRWPKFDVQSLEAFRGTGDQPATWGDEKTITIVCYWRIEYADAKAKSGRPIQKPTVKWSICSATQVLEGFGSGGAQDQEGIWPGKRIPLFPVVGKLMNIDGQVIMQGMVEPAMDSQRMVNYMYSGAVELTALSSKDPIVVDPAAIEGWELIWQRSQVDSLALIPARTWHPDNPNLRFEKPYKMGNSSQIAACVEMLQVSEEGIKATTGIFDPSLGSANPSQKTKGGILALQQQADQGNSHWIEAFKNTLVEYADEVITVLPHYLDRPGRIIQIEDKNGDTQHVMVNQPFTKGKDGPQVVMHPDTGKPVMDPQVAAEITNGVSQFFDLTAGGQYAVTATVGKNLATQREAQSAAIGQLIEASPEYMIPRIADVYVETLSFPGHQKIAERLKMGNPFAQEANQAPDPVQLQQENQQLKAQMAELQKAADPNKTKLTIAAQGDALDWHKAQLEAQTKIAVADIMSKNAAAIADVKAQIDVYAKVAGLVQEERLAEKAHMKDAAQSMHDSAHELALGAAEHVRTKELADQQHQQALEQSQQGHQQALEQGAQPPPVDPNAQSQEQP